MTSHSLGSALDFLFVKMGQDAGIDRTAVFLRIFGIYAFYINFSYHKIKFIYYETILKLAEY